jgi:hypothetical protein
MYSVYILHTLERSQGKYEAAFNPWVKQKVKQENVSFAGRNRTPSVSRKEFNNTE